MSAGLQFDGVHFAHPGAPPSVRGVELAVAPGEVNCLLGRSGCGKTTLLKLAAGLLSPSAGRVRIGGRPPAQVRAGIGFVFQSPTLLEWLRVIDNVLLPLSLQRRPTEGDRARARLVLARLGLEEKADHYPRQLSGGQQSRAALARALLPGPSVLLMDEPFAALDALTREDLQRDLLGLCAAEGTTVLFVTHDIAEAVFLGDRVSLMAEGRLVREFEIGLPRPRGEGHRASAAFAEECARIRGALGAPFEMADAGTGGIR